MSRGLLGTSDAYAADLKRAQLLLKTLPQEFSTLVGKATDDVADGVADLVRANVPRGLYPNVYAVLRGWVSTGRTGARGGKLKHVVELRVSPRGRKFSGFNRPNATYRPQAMPWWYEFGAKGGDDYVSVQLSTGTTKDVSRKGFDDYARRAQSQYVESYVDRRGNVRNRVTSRRSSTARQVTIQDVNESSATRQLPSYDSRGHWITPTLDRNAEDIYAAWLESFNDAVVEWEASLGNG